MKHLSKFSPAETLLLLEDKNASIKELLKTTFMDLLFKQVVQITNVSKQSNSRDEVRVYNYVVRGKNFPLYKPLEHENVYLSPYYKSSSIKILLQHLVRMGFQNSKSESKYISSVRQSPKINSYFTENIFQTIFGGFSVTQDGIELRNKIKSEITQLEKDLPPIISINKGKALEILKVIGGNIFLLKNIDFALLKQIDHEILAEMNRRYQGDNTDNGCYGCSYWHSGCTSWSGCSAGCSGCSGCSGCGGGCT